MDVTLTFISAAVRERLGEHVRKWFNELSGRDPITVLIFCQWKNVLTDPVSMLI